MSVQSEPVSITRNGKEQGVLLSSREYAALKRQALVSAVQEGRKSGRAGTLDIEAIKMRPRNELIIDAYYDIESCKEDLIDIWLYGHKVWGESLADRYLDGLYDAISLLSSNPYRYPEYQDKNVAPFRLMPIKNHLIAYEVSGSNIFIVRVLHESMDTVSRMSVSSRPSE